MSTKSKIESYLSSPIFHIVAGLLLTGCGLGAISVVRNSFLVILMMILSLCGVSTALYGFLRITDGKETGRMLVGKTLEDYLSSPIFLLVVGLLLGGFGLLAMSAAAGLAMLLTLFGFSVAAYGLVGTLEGKQIRTLTKKELHAVRELAQNLKVHYPTYILKVQKLKEKYEALHEKSDEIRTQSEEFKTSIKALQTGLAELETQLHNNLQKHATIIDNDNVDGIAKKIIWSDQQLELTQLETVLKTLAETETPIVPDDYRSVLRRIHKDFKRLDDGVTLYHELLTTCTKETEAFDTIQALKEEVEGIDALIVAHETELLKLETDTQTRYEMSKMALSMFQERFDEFKAGCE